MQVREVATGQTFWIKGIAVAKNTLMIQVFYYDEEGLIWTLPAGEFFDGRFVVDIELPGSHNPPTAGRPC